MPRDENILRQKAGGPMVWLMALAPLVFRLLRAVWPIPHFGKTFVVTRYDDVRAVFLDDRTYRVPYREKLDVIMGGQPFFLGMDDTADYRRDTGAMRQVVLRSDVPTLLAPDVERLAQDAVDKGNGQLEVVDSLVRHVTFKVFGKYFGITDPPGEDLRVWATRLFEFQFADAGNDPALRSEVDHIAPALCAHVLALIEARLQSGMFGDDVLGRCLTMQAKGEIGFSDDQIRTALIGFMVGGPPQPPMVLPQALEQLLRRPDALAQAQQAARDGDDALLAGFVFEAMRFDPLAPALPRVATQKSVIAVGTRHMTTIPSGANVYAAFSSAMMDERRIPSQLQFNPRRQPHEYIHFGHGLHTCFGIHMNQALLPLMLKPLLKRSGLRRAPGRPGHLSKSGAFSNAINVLYD